MSFNSSHVFQRLHSIYILIGFLQFLLVGVVAISIPTDGRKIKYEETSGGLLGYKLNQNDYDAQSGSLDSLYNVRYLIKCGNFPTIISFI